MVEIAHEVVFKDDETGKKFYLRRMANRKGNFSYFLKENERKQLIRFHGNLPKKINEVLERHGLKLSSSNELLSVDVGGNSYRYFPLVELPEGVNASRDTSGKMLVEIGDIGSEFSNWLDERVWSADVYGGVRAFFDENFGNGARGTMAKILAKNRIAVPRAILLALHRMRTGKKKEDTYYMEPIGRISPDVEDAVKKQLKRLGDADIQKLADIVNNDKEMAILRRKHKMPEFTVEELMNIKHPLRGKRNGN